ncbi:hypothetical protein BMS3Abin15_01040 [bacterium BMS3Abin15]|nr:hypothetical protein BMS3Abin15_01040 [bacterium BMS3Abin15]
MNIKKTVYITAAVFMGLLLAVIAHGFIEIFLIKKLLGAGLVPQSNILLSSCCYLPTLLQLVLLGSGLIGGYFLGQSWWRIVYVEKRHWRVNKK